MKTLVSLLLLVPAFAHADKSYVDGTGGNWDCGKDPNVSILANDGTYVIKGTCKVVSINGNNNKVTVEKSKAVDVNGNQNNVEVASVDALSANGNENTVTAKTIGKSSSNGNNNKLNAGKATAAATSSTAIDCAKDPTYAITGGDGTYTFTGACTKISLAGGSNKITIESVKDISVAGSKNTIDIGAVDKISNTGSDNHVTYKKGISGAKPKVSSIGSRTTVEPSK